MHWREKLEGGATVVERAADGWPALVAAGGLHYLGGWPDEIALDRILRRACDAAGVAVEPMPGSLRCRDSGRATVLLQLRGRAAAPRGRDDTGGRGALDAKLSLREIVQAKRSGKHYAAITA